MTCHTPTSEVAVVVRNGAGVGVGEKEKSWYFSVVSWNVHTWECYPVSSALSVKQDSTINTGIYLSF